MLRDGSFQIRHLTAGSIGGTVRGIGLGGDRHVFSERVLDVYAEHAGTGVRELERMQSELLSQLHACFD